MDQPQLEYTLRSYKCLKGGTREASIIVRDFLKTATPVGDVIYKVDTCVTPAEFMKAVRVLLAKCFLEPDTVPKRWHCVDDCAGVSCFICSGECNIDSDAPEQCPFYTEEDK